MSRKYIPALFNVWQKEVGMVKLVVADDEERVCRLIVALGNWEELGIKVVGTAANGIQALELIRKEKQIF